MSFRVCEPARVCACAVRACRFSYSPEFLAWALQPPGYRTDWHVGVRVKGTGKLVAFISGIPSTIQVRRWLTHALCAAQAGAWWGVVLLPAVACAGHFQCSVAEESVVASKAASSVTCLAVCGL